MKSLTNYFHCLITLTNANFPLKYVPLRVSLLTALNEYTQCCNAIKSCRYAYIGPQTELFQRQCFAFLLSTRHSNRDDVEFKGIHADRIYQIVISFVGYFTYI